MTTLLSFVFLFLVNTEDPRTAQLAQAIHAYAPGHVTLDEAFEHAQAALAAERPGISAELLLSVAFRESGWDPRACPRKECDSGKAWLWPDKKPKRKLKHYICGVLQSTEKTWQDCIDARILKIGYENGAASMERKLASCTKKKRKDLTECMLDGYAGKDRNHALVLWRAQWFHDYEVTEDSSFV